ncbi:histamine H1 receptor-like [Strongylocentrotus purpuratus]|uniref:G-protein coupled receptors family 1 profile domain-containing protein n=1 Tax=Strongylocentrotus purpuratus TaxID=7668 RepID=A0A7M7GHI8_STRPU|nr:histamine H1 receptor-like [Strongylocentrotus purpuratus]|eukprot:XP_003729651.1 PREDICTED: histamine H1 receptor-like [Strongylocentrotus purpuratus]
MVIVAYFRDKSIRARAANLLILNLAITDLPVGALMWPFNLTWIIKGYWPFGEVLCKIWSLVDYVVGVMSILTMVLISWDRYCLVTMGLKYQTFQTKKRIGLIICITWAVVFVWFTLLAFAWSPLTGQYKVDYEEECELEFTSSLAMTLFVNVLVVFIPLTVLVVLNVSVYTNIKRRSKGIVGQSPADGLSTRANKRANDRESPRQDKCNSSAASCLEEQGTLADSSSTSANADTELTEALPNENVSNNAPQANGSGSKERTFARHRKAAVVLGILVGCFLVCLLPVQVTNVMFAICRYDCVSFLTWDITNSFVWGNSMINPFIYAATNKHFRRNFRRYLLFDSWACARKQRGP